VRLCFLCPYIWTEKGGRLDTDPRLHDYRDRMLVSKYERRQKEMIKRKRKEMGYRKVEKLIFVVYFTTLLQ
jgi:hypothetical protein